MKRTTTLLAAALLAALPLFAADPEPAAPPPLAPADPDKDRLELMPSKPAQLMPPPTGLPLIPEIPQMPEKGRKPAVDDLLKKRNTTTSDAEDAVKQRVRLREVKTRALRDPSLQAEWDRAALMKTDYERREVTRNYYRLLFARMAKIDPALKGPIDLQLKEALGRLEQNHIAPTQPPATAARAQR